MESVRQLQNKIQNKFDSELPLLENKILVSLESHDKSSLGMKHILIDEFYFILTSVLFFHQKKKIRNKCC